MEFEVYESLRRILDRLWPGSCLLCRAALPCGRDLCSICERSLPYLDAACRICARPLPVSAAGQVCGHCQQSPPSYDYSFAAFRYASPIDRLVQDLKYHRRLDLARVLGGLLAERLAAHRWPWPDRLIPVPLHRARLRERGFNQALELARPAARRFGLVLDPWAAVRIRPTPPQAGLSLAQRRRNLRGAFRATVSLEGEHVVVLDDVMTSGSSLESLAHCLKKAGAKTVGVWVLARA
jgi:ComF family protein